MKQRRRAFTILEMSVTMVISASVMGLLAVMFSHMLVGNATSNEHLERIVTLGRLGEQFRRDVHAAAHATLSKAANQSPVLELAEPDDATVRYEISDSVLHRVATKKGQPQRRELFFLPGMKFLGWNDDFEHSGHLTLSIDRISQPGADEFVRNGPVEIRAALAKNSNPKPEQP